MNIQKHQVGLLVTNALKGVVADMPDHARVARVGQQILDEFDVGLIVIRHKNERGWHQFAPLQTRRELQRTVRHSSSRGTAGAPV